MLSTRHQTEYELWFLLHEFLEMTILNSDLHWQKAKQLLPGMKKGDEEEANITESLGVVDMF